MLRIKQHNINIEILKQKEAEVEKLKETRLSSAFPRGTQHGRNSSINSDANGKFDSQNSSIMNATG